MCDRLFGYLESWILTFDTRDFFRYTVCTLHKSTRWHNYDTASSLSIVYFTYIRFSRQAMVSYRKGTDKIRASRSILRYFSLISLLPGVVLGFTAPLPHQGFHRSSSLSYSLHEIKNSLPTPGLTGAFQTTATPRHYTRLTPRAMSSGNQKLKAKKPPSSLTLPQKVGGFYGVLGVMVWNAVGQKIVPPVEATAGVVILWMGFVLAISFTEAWVKFQAPFLPKHYGLDVGRTVFPVLNAVEVAFCFTLWLIQITAKARLSSLIPPLVATTIILLSQVVYMTPQLVLLGKYVIRDAFPAPDPKWNSHQESAYHNLTLEVNQTIRPSSKVHIVYVLQEFVKVILFGTIVWKCRGLWYDTAIRFGNTHYVLIKNCPQHIGALSVCVPGTEFSPSSHVIWERSQGFTGRQTDSDPKGTTIRSFVPTDCWDFGRTILYNNFTAWDVSDTPRSTSPSWTNTNPLNRKHLMEKKHTEPWIRPESLAIIQDYQLIIN